MVDAESEADRDISGGVLALHLDNSGDESEGDGAGPGGGFLELQMLLGQQLKWRLIQREHLSFCPLLELTCLPLKGILCGVQLGPCHDLSAWLLSSSYVGWCGDHGSHGDGHHV